MPAAMVPITPSSVTLTTGTSATIVGNRIDIVAAQDYTLNDIFSATYKHYFLQWIGDADGQAQPACNLKVSGGATATTDYAFQWLSARNTSTSALRSTTASGARLGILGLTATNIQNFYISYPYEASPTLFYLQSASSDDGGARLLDYASEHTVSTSYQSLVVFDGGAFLFTGSLWIYGLVS